MKYRARPVEIEAFQFDGDLMNANGKYYVPAWAVSAYKSGILYYSPCKETGYPELYVRTLEGNMRVPVGNYVIKGTADELYSCVACVFENKYEEVK